MQIVLGKNTLEMNEFTENECISSRFVRNRFFRVKFNVEFTRQAVNFSIEFFWVNSTYLLGKINYLKWNVFYPAVQLTIECGAFSVLWITNRRKSKQSENTS